jgi:hypothetical protein
MSVNQGIQIGVESTHGTGVAASKDLEMLIVTLSPQIDTVIKRPKGCMHNAVILANKDWTDGKYEGAGSYSECIYPISGVLGAATVTTPGGGTLSLSWA